MYFGTTIGIYRSRLKRVPLIRAKGCFCSPGVDSMGVMHEVRRHLKGNADRIARGNRILQPHLIVLERRESVAQTFSKPLIKKKKKSVDLPT